MAFVGFGDQFLMFDCTPVENLFIQEYMLRAEGEFVKAYLYGLMQCYHPQEGASLSTMARDLGMEESRLRNAFSYWERQGLIRRISDNPVQYVFLNLKQALLMKAQDDDGLYRYADFNQSLQALFGPDRLLAPQDYERVYDWIEGLGLPEPVVLLMVAHCIQARGLKFRFSSVDKLARDWAQEGIKTIADAEDMIRRSTLSYESLKQVLRRLGKRHAPSMEDEALYLKWTQDWGFTLEAILAACTETTKGSPTMAYLDGILKRQHQMGLHDAMAISSQWRKEREDAAPVKELFQAMGVRGLAPTPEWIQAYEKLTSQGFSHGALLLGAKQVSRFGGKLDSLLRLLESWQQRGLLDESAVQAYLDEIQQRNQILTQLFAKAGESRRPNTQDRNLLSKWTDLGISQPLMELAAEYSVNASQKMPFMDAILTAWHQAQVQTLEQAKAAHEQHQQSPGKPAPNTRPSKEVAEHRYTQREYAQEDLDSLAEALFPEEEEGGRGDGLRRPSF